MKNMKYGFYFFHVNANPISPARISNKRLKLINAKAAVKQKNLLITPQRYYNKVAHNNKNINYQQAIRDLTTYCFYLILQQKTLATDYVKSYGVINNATRKQLYYKDISETISYTFIR